MMQTRNHLTKAKRCAGFGVVELMVALVISLILLGGVGQIFLSSKKSYQIQTSMARQQENGRFIIEIINQDLRRAGYWGGNADITTISGSQTALLTEDSTCSTTSGDSSWGRKLGSRIFGFNDSESYACIADADYSRGDVLVVRYAAPWEVGTGGITTPTIDSPDDDDRLYIRSTLFESRLFKGSEANNSENLLNIPATRTAEMIAHAYYIGPSSSPNCTENLPTAQQPVPSLFRETLDADGEPEKEEIAYGVDHLQVQYGLDTDNDLSVDFFVDADNVSDWSQVISAKVWLLTRAECPETGYTNDLTYTMGDIVYDPPDGDAFRRQLYTSTVRLRNR